MMKYVITKQSLDSAFVSICELINQLEDNRQELCVEDMSLLYQLKQSRNELFKLQMNEMGDVYEA